MKLLGIAPKGIFSGFESSFFEAVRNHGAKIDVLEVDLPIFKMICSMKTIAFSKSEWGLRRDLAYNTSIEAFQKKTIFSNSYVKKFSNNYDAIYQIGGLWNPVPEGLGLPLIISLDYTSILSEKRHSEWKRKPGKEKNFWIEEEKKLFNRANVICATTGNAKKSLVDDYDIDIDKIHIVGPGVSYPYNDFNINKMPDYSSKRILFVGKGVKGKGLDTLLEAFLIVRNKVPEAILTVIGPSVPISVDGVEYLGRINKKEIVKEWYYKSAVFAMPSIFEPVGQVFLEAMSCKLPCIGTTLDAMPELIDDSVTGYTIEPGNVNELANKIFELISNPNIACSKGMAGYKKLLNNYTWEIVGKKIFSRIQEVLELP